MHDWFQKIILKINIAEILDIEGYLEQEIALTPDARRHWLKVFISIFERTAFLLDAVDGRQSTSENRFITLSLMAKYRQKI